MSIPKVNIVIVAGDTWSDTFEFYRDGVPRPMNDAPLVMQFRPMTAMFGTTDEETLILELTLGSGIEWIEDHIARVTIPEEDTKLLNPSNSAAANVAWGLQVEGEEGRKMMMQGRAKVLGRIVR